MYRITDKSRDDLYDDYPRGKKLKIIAVSITQLLTIFSAVYAVVLERSSV